MSKTHCDIKTCKDYARAEDSLKALLDCRTREDLTVWKDEFNNVLCMIVSRELPARLTKDKNVLYTGKCEEHRHIPLKHLPLQAYIFAMAFKKSLEISPIRITKIATAPPSTAVPVSAESIAKTPEETCGYRETFTANKVARPVLCGLKKVPGRAHCAIHELEESERILSQLRSDVAKIITPPASPVPIPAPKIANVGKKSAIGSKPPPVTPAAPQQKKILVPDRVQPEGLTDAKSWADEIEETE